MAVSRRGLLPLFLLLHSVLLVVLFIIIVVIVSVFMLQCVCVVWVLCG